MKRFVTAITLASLILAGFGSWSCSPKGYSGPVESIRFAAIPSGSAALVYIAQDQGFFAANGLSVNVSDYATGVATTEALLKDEVDIAWSAEVPLIRRAFAREKVSIISVVSRFTDEYLFVPKDRGIEGITQLRGKKIGVPRGTIAEFYLGRLLRLNGLSTQDVSLVDIPPSKAMEAITKEDIDGVITWEPFANQIKTQLAGKVIAFSIQSSQAGYGLAIVRNEWISAKPAVISRFLKSLTQAEDYLIRNPEAGKDIVQKRVNYDDTFMEVFWSEVQFSLFLDQSLILAMEDEARWMINSNLTNEKTVPNFLDYINESALKAVKPGAVNIIR